MTRKEILEAADTCVCRDRNDQYGPPENIFALIGRLWGVYLRALTGIDEIPDISPDAVAMMLLLLKVARIATGKPHADNYVDLAGYAACAGEIALKGMGRADT